MKHVTANDTQVICHAVKQMSSAFVRSRFIAPKDSKGDWGCWWARGRRTVESFPVVWVIVGNLTLQPDCLVELAFGLVSFSLYPLLNACSMILMRFLSSSLILDLSSGESRIWNISISIKYYCLFLNCHPRFTVIMNTNKYFYFEDDTKHANLTHLMHMYIY